MKLTTLVLCLSLTTTGCNTIPENTVAEPKVEYDWGITCVPSGKYWACINRYGNWFWVIQL